MPLAAVGLWELRQGTGFFGAVTVAGWALAGSLVLASAAVGWALAGSGRDPSRPDTGTDGDLSASAYRELLLHLPQLFFFKDTRSIYRFCNDNFAASRGLSAAEVPGKTDFDFFPPGLAREFQASDQAIIASGEAVVFEEPFSDGQGLKTVQVVKAPVRDGQGRIVGVLGILWDLTEIRRTESALMGSENRARALADAAFEALFISEQGICLDQNLTAERMFGYSPAEAVGRPGTDWIVPEDRDLVMRNMLSGQEEPYRTRGLRKDGSVFHAEIQAKMFDQADGRKVRVTALRDITDQVLARENSTLLSTITEQLSVSVLVTDLEINTTYANQAFCDMVRCGRDDFLGRKPTSLFADEAQAAILPAMLAALHGKRSWRGEVMLRRLDGAVFPCDLTILPLFDEQGDLFGYASTQIDLTDRQEAEQQRLNLERQIQQAQKLDSLAVLAGGIAHDFNNILMIIQGNTELILDQVPADGPAARQARTIKSATLRATELAGQMQAYSGHGQLEVAPLDLNALLNGMEHLLSVAVAKNVRLEFRLAGSVPALLGDPAQVRQIIMNLVKNAAEALPDGVGSITVSTGRLSAQEAAAHGEAFRAGAVDSGAAAGPGFVFLEVADTGCGMDAETSARVFDPFFSTKFPGRGLGMAAVSGIVRGHGGVILLETAPGQGSRFKVLLPATDRAPVDLESGREVRALPTAPFGLDRQVLLVDDEPEIRDLGRQQLSALGFRVLGAGDGREALETYRRHAGSICCVLMDVAMPNLEGDEALRRLRKEFPALRAILISGYPESDAAGRFRGLAGVGYLQKPFSVERLANALKAQLAPADSPGR